MWKIKVYKQPDRLLHLKINGKKVKRWSGMVWVATAKKKVGNVIYMINAEGRSGEEAVEKVREKIK
jgi:hypothetical protein